MVVWYGIIPIAGALHSRYKWGQFRRRFDRLRLRPLLDYLCYRRIGGEGGVFRFTGGIESITAGHTLWVKSDSLTIPVSLANVQCWLFTMQDGGGMPEAPERINWNRISTLNEGAKVFVGGLLKIQDNRPHFISTKEKPLMVIFYDCPDHVLTGGIIRSGRTHNEYWNSLTPASLVTGALSLAYLAASLLNRPAFQIIIISALIAIFVPVLPLFPPGLIIMILYRRMAWNARNFRAYRDIARLPLRYLPSGRESSVLSTGEKYGCLKIDTLPDTAKDSAIPPLIPEHIKSGKKEPWHIYGVIDENASLPGKSKDPFVSFGALPGSPQRLARNYGIKAYILESAAWVVLLLSIGMNIVFILMTLYLLRLISF